MYNCCNSFLSLVVFFFFKQKTASEMRISDWSSDVCSSVLDDRSVEAAFEQADRLEHGRLARARRAQQRHDLAVPHREVDAAKHFDDARPLPKAEIGRASCRERVWKDV